MSDTDTIEAPDKPAATDTRKRAVRIRAGTLLDALKDVLGAVVARSEIPILSHVLFRAGDGRVVLLGSDLDLWVERDCASDDRDGPGSADWAKSIRGFQVALPAKPLAAILGELDGDAMVTIAIEDAEGEPDDLTETYSGQATISADRARFRLNCLPSGEFPQAKDFHAATSFELACGELGGAFDRVAHAISTEETRYYLNGVFVHVAQAEGLAAELRFVATDGHRLARWSIDVPEGAAAWPDTIVQRRTVDLLDRLLAAAVKAAGDKDAAPQVLVERASGEAGALLRFSLPAKDGGDITVTAKSIDGSFPDYGRVIPTDPQHTLRAVRSAMAEAVKRVGVLASDKTRSVKLALADSGTAELLVTTPELGGAVEQLPVTWSGPSAQVGFDGKYWREVLGALASDEVVLRFDAKSGESVVSPVLVESGASDEDATRRLVQVLMPMRVA